MSHVLHSMWLWAMVWILAEDSIDNYDWVMFAHHQDPFCFSQQPTSEGNGDVQEVVRGHSQGSWLQLATGISHSIWHLAQHIYLGEEGRKGGTFGVVAFVFPSNCSVWWELFWKWLNTCLPHRNQWINSLLCFAYVYTSYITYLTVFISVHGFLTSVILIFSPSEIAIVPNILNSRKFL